MSGVAGLVIGAAIVWLVFFQQKPSPTRGPRTLTIGIYTPAGSKNCEVDFPVAVVSLARHEKIAWESEDKDYSVEFTPSGDCQDSTGYPFPNSTPIPVPKPTSTSTPPSGQAPNRKGHFCYEVKDASGNVCNDPGLHVKD
jgi:hypothetical protein